MPFLLAAWLYDPPAHATGEWVVTADRCQLAFRPGSRHSNYCERSKIYLFKQLVAAIEHDAM
jgi:hypothetical protein